MRELTLPLLAGVIAAAIEYPISQKYKTVPHTSTATRMLIAGAMAAGAVYAAQQLMQRRLIT